jgi:hypothetical protein
LEKIHGGVQIYQPEKVCTVGSNDQLGQHVASAKTAACQKKQRTDRLSLKWARKRSDERKRKVKLLSASVLYVACNEQEYTENFPVK